ncbi:hypothetical protein [Flexithrix dorotheae]|uniref:hypothetical protein n=1 Tax=Flexithrix dorotheae TaxID=70993 RepID=UPI00146ADB28|nr:hypothetical protein [Flexithrix dorotheae]
MTTIIGLVTALFIWIYVQRVKLDYNSEGKFFSAEEGVVYLEPAEETYGFLALSGLIMTGTLMTLLIIRRKKGS